MRNEKEPGVAARLVQLLDRLGLAQAHFAARSALDILSLAARAPERIASIALQGAAARPDDLGALEERTLWLLGDDGEMGRAMAPRLASRTKANVHWLAGYREFGWSDTAVDRGDELARTLLEFWSGIDRTLQLPAVGLSDEGEVDGLTYRAAGSGTPVVLLPLGLSPHQWDPVLPLLQARHCTIVLGGRHLQPVENLEARGDGDYSRMTLGFLDLAAPRDGDALIEVGCGCGALLRRIARRPGLGRVVGLDVNAFLLREARALAEGEGLAGRLELQEGSAEAIPFPDDTFDVAFSSTVMEEVDADRMLAEMVRITKPGGRVAVIVRSVDRERWTNLPLPKALRAKLETPAGGRADRGCADESLYRRFRDAGLKDVRGGPALASVHPHDAWWQNLEAEVLRSLDSEEVQTLRSVLADAERQDLPVWVARPFHCAVGIK